MARFRYEATDINGADQVGTMTAASAAAAVERVTSQGLQLLAIEQLGRLHWLHLLNPLRYTPIAQRDLTLVFRQLALMVRSGNTLLEGLQTTAALSDKLTVRRLLTRVAADIQKGSSFSEALELRGRQLPRLIPSLVAFGESSGELEATFERLAEHFERRVLLRQQLVSSILYPIVVVSAAIAVGLFLAIVIIPKFKPLLADRMAQLPESTVLLIDLSEWLVQYGAWLGLALVVLVLLLLAAYTTQRGKVVLDRVLIDLPVVGRSIRHAEMAQMGWTMWLLMRAGITVQESLRTMSETLGNASISQTMVRAREGILNGQSLSLSLQQPLIPVMVRNMVALGERSGELERVMRELGEYYRNSSEERYRRLAAFIEPTMVLLVGGVVAFVYFAFFNALFRLSAG